MPQWAWAVLGVGVFASGSVFCALAESALFSLGRSRAGRLAAEDPGRGTRVVSLLESPQDLLAAISLGNTFTNTMVTALVLWAGLRGGWSPPVLGGVLLGTFLLILLGCEVVPKTLAVRAPERWSVRVAGPMAFLVRLTRPLRLVAMCVDSAFLRRVIPRSLQPPPGLTDEEYDELLEIAVQRGSITASEQEVIREIIRLDRRGARDVMRPRSQLAVIPDDLSVEEMIAAARRLKHRRLPMYDQTPDTIVGVLNTRRLLLDPEADLADVIEFPSFVPESMNLLQLLQSLQRQQRGMAVVLDEYGGTAGVVTAEDILEELLGKFRGETGQEGVILERLGEGRWRVSAALRLEDFRRQCPTLGQLPEVDTLGGLAVHVAEAVPQVGDSVTWRDLRLTVTAGEERRVRELLVEVLARKGGR